MLFRSGRHQALSRQRGDDAVNGGPGQPNPVGKLREAETLRFSGKGTEYLANARDDLDAAGCFRRPGKLCLRVCHNASLFDRAKPAPMTGSSPE